MKTIQSFDLGKAPIVLACAMTLAAFNGAQALESPTFSNQDIDKACAVERVPSYVSPLDGFELVMEPSALKADRSDRLSRKFQQLSQQWRDERGTMSSINDMSMLAPYQNIIGMGPDALPLILAQLRAEGDDPDQWFWALLTISEANDMTPPQIKEEDQGNFKKMADAWLEWGESQVYAG
jgi:hypothetical protein